VSFPNGLRGLAGRRGPIEPKGLNKVRPYLAVRTLRRLRTAIAALETMLQFVSPQSALEPRLLASRFRILTEGNLFQSIRFGRTSRVLK
jgi:hypothetical protein